jgi:hypothetical protein
MVNIKLWIGWLVSQLVYKHHCSMNNTMLIKHNMLSSSYLFYQSVPVEGERNVVDLTLWIVECSDVYGRAVSNLAL